MDYKEGNRLIIAYLGGIETIYPDGSRPIVLPGRDVILGGIEHTHFHDCIGWLIPAFKKAKIDYVPTDVNRAYKLILEIIKNEEI